MGKMALSNELISVVSYKKVDNISITQSNLTRHVEKGQKTVLSICTDSHLGPLVYFQGCLVSSRTRACLLAMIQDQTVISGKKGHVHGPLKTR